MKYLLAILFVLFIGCSSQQTFEEQEDTIIHEYSGFKFKTHLGTFTRGVKETFDNQENNVAFSYFTNVNYPMLLTLYVYPVNEEADTTLPAALTKFEKVAGHFNLCKEEIRKADERDELVNTTLVKEERSRINNIDWMTAVYEYNMRGQNFESVLYLTCFNNSFLKIRVTFDKSHNIEVYSKIRNLIKDINWEDSTL